jgi:hypothetical protein
MDVAKASQVGPNQPQIRSIAHSKNMIDISGRNSAPSLRAFRIYRQKLSTQRAPGPVISSSRRIRSPCVDHAFPLSFALGKRLTIGMAGGRRTLHKLIASANGISENSIRTTKNLTGSRFQKGRPTGLDPSPPAARWVCVLRRHAKVVSV